MLIEKYGIIITIFFFRKDSLDCLPVLHSQPAQSLNLQLIF